jgi:hypothetical protein
MSPDMNASIAYAPIAMDLCHQDCPAGCRLGGHLARDARHVSRMAGVPDRRRLWL